MIKLPNRHGCSLAVIILATFLSGSAFAESIRGDGPSIAFQSAYGTENAGSSVNRQWIIVNDESLPVELTSFQVIPRLGTRFRGFSIEYSINSGQPISALEVRFIPFDIWGTPSRPMSATHIQDISAGSQAFSSEWSSITESAVSRHFVMIGYIAQIRLNSGEIVKANLNEVIEEARRLSEGFGADNLSVEQ